MKKFKVEAVKDEDGLVIGVRAARANDRDVIIALNDVPERLTWEKAVKCNIPSNSEWTAIFENIDIVNRLIKKNGGEPLENDWYWSSSEHNGYYHHAWVVYPPDGDMDNANKDYNNYRVRCKM